MPNIYASRADWIAQGNDPDGPGEPHAGCFECPWAHVGDDSLSLADQHHDESGHTVHATIGDDDV